ncbi:hypothetical protein MKQ68_03545 [Chitinophaga horti]|uniref:Uncharacterized protein n=1 Tax=Chitinophaga horti TaxID=2920382 RepID=A0ABY6J7N6_9BACT|nr:hypothetical protein [Chitinophaga horti]UYQ94164.1 hypothetical protein MKQ68_03545 [Chitinophaga horti]
MQRRYNMGHTKQLKRILSVLALVLYGFMITPVSLWHAHDHGHEQTITSGDDCPVCDHSYTPYISTHQDWNCQLVVTRYFYIDAHPEGIAGLPVHHGNTRGSPVV